MFKAIRGTKDILPQEATIWQKIEAQARKIAELYGYQEIRTPVIEEAALFSRSLGKSSEVVQKQMFQIHRDNDVFVLRPEATASIARAYIENNLDKKQGFIKLYYAGPMFRAERPQKGRLRQFHHFGVEAIGSANPYLDVEIISLANRMLQSIEVGEFQIGINSLGCVADKHKLAEELKTKLKAKLSQLCVNCKDRFKRNVFRVLDCKEENCRKVCLDLGLGNDCLCTDCRDHFQKVREGLDSLGINYAVLPFLVRGLDYYTRTVFEITHKNLGSQDALGAGGRYDNLIHELGGPEVPAIGFALGIERILLVTKSAGQSQEDKFVYIVAMGDQANRKALQISQRLHEEKLQAFTDYREKSLKSAMRKANDLGARFVVIIGEDELKNNLFSLKDMKSGDQRQLTQIDLIKELSQGRG